MTKRKRLIIMSASGLLVASTLVVALFALQGCGYGREMASLASRDTDVQSFFGSASEPLSFRKELLLPVSSGKDLGPEEDFIEVWRGDIKAGWVYYVIEEPLIHRSGYKRTDGQLVLSLGSKVNMKSIDTSGTKTTLIDGKEFK
jgi:hypothetical protein